MTVLVRFIIWFLLNVSANFLSIIALFTQTTKSVANANIYVKLLISEFWASILWMFVIPAHHLGYTLMTPIQISLAGQVFMFLSQLWANMFWLDLPTTIDDYIGMVLILFGMGISKGKLIG